MQTAFDYLKENGPRFVDELCTYLKFPSVSAQAQHAGDMRACADWLVAHCKRIGLSAEIRPTAGHPAVVARTPKARGGVRPHFVVYGHYDVQPPEPFDLWQTPPFEPSIRGRSLFARGSCDNKGQHFAHLKAVEAMMATGTELPCDLTFLIEGEEEVGSPNLPPLLRECQDELRCDAVVISDNGIPDLKHPGLTYGLRGILAIEVTLHGPTRDLHSGLYGGTLDNPAFALCRMLSALRDKRGKVAIPGFYEDVLKLSAYERKQLARVPHRDAAFRKFLGVPELFGEAGFTTTERRCARPTVEINGITSGYQGEGSKTIIPSWARVKLTFRLVPDQNPAKLVGLIRKHLKRICPPTVRMELKVGHGGEPYLMSPTDDKAQAAMRAIRQAFNCEPVLLREGGSIPIVTQFRKILGADSLLLGLSLPDDNAHSPNEKFDLDAFECGMRMGVALWPELSRVCQVPF
jgi:acetylornithine deacetylase/succinyl-diaminopimelate desuccinylase-like protein